MPIFAYQARDAGGRLIRGLFEAESQDVLAERLRKMGYLVTRMERAAATLQGFWITHGGRGAPPQEALLLAVIQLANLVEAGVPLVSSLQTVASQTTHGSLRHALEQVTREIEGGATLSHSLSHHPAIFPPLMVSLVSVGEATGTLDTIFTRFTDFLEKDLALQRTILGALLYPVLLLVAATALLLCVVTFVVPQFAALFAKAGLSLPLPTRILQVVGATIRTQGVLVGALSALGGVGGMLTVAQPRVRRWLDARVLALPVVGHVVHHTVVARFARTLSTVVGAGLPMLNALDTASAVVKNTVILGEIQRVRTAVERGERMAATLAAGKVFYPDAIQMIQVGEESGRLERMLWKIADFYELRVNFFLKQMTTLLEPILLVGMGGLVGLIMVALLLPMFDMVKMLQHGGIR